LSLTHDNIIFDGKKYNAIIKPQLKTHGKKSEYASTSDDVCKENLWIPNPFANHSDIKLLPLEESKLIELTINWTLEIIFRQKFLSAFWISIE
jgi:hypothetical protein